MSYRILSLDGGGTWALIQIKALMALYGKSASGRSVLQEFDLVAANSGGSIVLGGLVEGRPLGELLDCLRTKPSESPYSPQRALSGTGPARINGARAQVQRGKQTFGIAERVSCQRHRPSDSCRCRNTPSRLERRRASAYHWIRL